MRQLYLERRYFLNTPIEKCSLLVQKTLTELGFKKVTIKREVSPRYLLVECDPGWAQTKSEIEFVFEETQNRSKVSFKWFYSTDFFTDGATERVKAKFTMYVEGRRQKAERLIEEFKSRIGAIEVPIADAEKVPKREVVKEVVKEIEVIVKVRCSYCNKLYDETLGLCPHCGGH